MTAPQKRISEMSDDQKCQVIAESCGITFNAAGLPVDVIRNSRDEIVWHDELILPDYFYDLNAIREAVMMLPRTEHDLYDGTLTVVVANDNPNWTSFDIVNATAQQRAITLLLTLGHEN